MEDVVLGTKRTIPFWRARRPRLVLERALASLRQLGSGKSMITAPQLVTVRSRSRLQQEGRKKRRFAEG
ncbi:hypothetical protein D3C83_171570 [compost metagenome]